MRLVAAPSVSSNMRIDELPPHGRPSLPSAGRGLQQPRHPRSRHRRTLHAVGGAFALAAAVEKTALAADGMRHRAVALEDMETRRPTDGGASTTACGLLDRPTNSTAPGVGPLGPVRDSQEQVSVHVLSFNAVPWPNQAATTWACLAPPPQRPPSRGAVRSSPLRRTQRARAISWLGGGPRIAAIPW